MEGKSTMEFTGLILSSQDKQEENILKLYFYTLSILQVRAQAQPDEPQTQSGSGISNEFSSNKEKNLATGLQQFHKFITIYQIPIPKFPFPKRVFCAAIETKNSNAARTTKDIR
jgi:hypothetical protein